ncbi:hypothetical protein BJ912DRAFT_523118 [Pholiota molesta]|nr:hypothetical protein BJ912DRAFT_523118 [Pholiota molesta]
MTTAFFLLLPSAHILPQILAAVQPHPIHLALHSPSTRPRRRSCCSIEICAEEQTVRPGFQGGCQSILLCAGSDMVFLVRWGRWRRDCEDGGVCCVLCLGAGTRLDGAVYACLVAMVVGDCIHGWSYSRLCAFIVIVWKPKKPQQHGRCMLVPDTVEIPADVRIIEAHRRPRMIRLRSFFTLNATRRLVGTRFVRQAGRRAAGRMGIHGPGRCGQLRTMYVVLHAHL